MPLPLQLGTQGRIILDNPVMHQGKRPVVARMRVGIHIVRLPMRGPAGMAQRGPDRISVRTRTELFTKCESGCRMFTPYAGWGCPFPAGRREASSRISVAASGARARATTAASSPRRSAELETVGTKSAGSSRMSICDRSTLARSGSTGPATSPFPAPDLPLAGAAALTPSGCEPRPSAAGLSLKCANLVFFKKWITRGPRRRRHGLVRRLRCRAGYCRTVPYRSTLSCRTACQQPMHCFRHHGPSLDQRLRCQILPRCYRSRNRIPINPGHPVFPQRNPNLQPRQLPPPKRTFAPGKRIRNHRFERRNPTFRLENLQIAVHRGKSGRVIPPVLQPFQALG